MILAELVCLEHVITEYVEKVIQKQMLQVTAEAFRHRIVNIKSFK